MDEPDTARTRAERNALPPVGARFFREGAEVRFTFVIDTANVIGPREATRQDQERFPDEWAVFLAADASSPLDRDGDGLAGGSLVASPAPAADEPAPPPKAAQGPRRARRGAR